MANIGGFLGMFLLFPKRVWGSVSYCTFVFTIRWFFHQLNRVIPVTVSIYRYMLICQNAAAERFGKQRLARLLHIVNNLVPVLCTTACLFYAEQLRGFAVCIEREEMFVTDLDNLLDSQDTSIWSTGRRAAVI